MTTIQKMEISAGVLTSLLALIFPCSLVYRFELINEATGKIDNLISIMLVIWLFSIPVAIGSYFHATRGSIFALIVVYFGGIVFIIPLAYISFFILIWGGLLNGGLAASPILMFVITAGLAFISTLRRESPPIKTNL